MVTSSGRADAAREAARQSDGKFGVQSRAESDVSLAPRADIDDDLRAAPRGRLLSDPEVRFFPPAWLADKSDDDLREAISSMRGARAAAEAEQEADRAAAEAEMERRRSYRRPGWLRMENFGGQRRYTTGDGYSGSEVEQASDGRTRTMFVVHSPTGGTATVDRVEQMADWITADRAERAETWTEAFPLDSAAAGVAAFRGKPVGRWFNDGGEPSYIAPDGSYVYVHEDAEPTGYWFVDGAWADGSTLDGGFSDSAAGAQAIAERVLRNGQAAYDRGEGW